ncbi:MAG: phosphatase [Coriobacteriia bacterium]|nr:phosphatase [Coriobacteriia bacterium]
MTNIHTASEAPCTPHDARLLAAIDVGTVSTRLILADVFADGRVRPLERQAIITNLGTGVDASGALDPVAIERTCATIAGYGARLAELADAGQAASDIAITLTSAARDASNADELLGRLAALGLDAQVIPGETEARLSLLGVTSDFPGESVLVADIGGGSTELIEGVRNAGGKGALAVGCGVSYDVGCRRVTERFFGASDIPSSRDVDFARVFIRTTLGAFFEGASSREAIPGTLACVGGTATSLVAVANELVPYDSSFVHLHSTSRSQVAELTARLLSLGASERRALPGLQPKRADVIAAGALILDELMDVGGFDAYVASESDSLFGLLTCLRCACDGAPSPIGWLPRSTPARPFLEACRA